MKHVSLGLIILVGTMHLTQAAAPVGETIWLHSVSTDSFVTVDPDDGYQIEAKGISSVGRNEQFIIEEAGGGHIRLKAVVNDHYVKVDTSNVNKLFAQTTSTTDTLAYFQWIELGDEKIRLTNIGNGKSVSPSGAQQVLRANKTTTGVETEFKWGAVSITSTSPSSNGPNIVMIFVDDWAWNGSPITMDDDMPNSMYPLLRMPNLECMANEGMKCENAYAGAPQCSPSRVCLQTGKSAPRSGYTVFMNSGGSDYYDTNKSYAQFPVVPCVSDMTIDTDAVTIPEALNPMGYACAHFGKWHMRGNPSDEGYVAHDGPTTNNEGNQQIPRDPKLMFSITERSLAFMEEQVQVGRPFYLQISHYAMHEGRECLPETRAKYQHLPEVVAYNNGVTNPEELKRKSDPAIWLGMGEDLDGRIGAVLNKLKDLGIADKTYVVVTSDNGYRQKEFSELSGLSQPLHAAKWWVWQGGLRVPMIAMGPGIPAASVCTANVVNYDFLPTFVEWAGGNPSRLHDIDGVSLASLLRGQAPSTEFLTRNLYFHYPHYRTTMPHSAVVSDMDKVMYFYETLVRFPENDPVMLFDLSTDVGEFTNITPDHPTRAQELYSEMICYLDEVDARLPLVPNPDYDPAVYENASEYDKRLLWGPFEGTRPREADEQHLKATPTVDQLR
ncbi:sulfatase-like hydrolase/transferase [Planctomycetota bacterium]